MSWPSLNRASTNPNYSAWSKYWPMLVLGLLIGLAFAEMAWLSVARYEGHNARAFDLGVMSQAIWSATQGEPLLFSLESVTLSRLARHVELIYLPMALAYAIWPSPPTLLIIQAALYALAAIPVYRLAYRHLEHHGPSLVITTIYLLYPVAQTSVLFDLHGDTLAMPVLLFVLESLDRRAWRSYAFWLMVALGCKVYVAVPVALLGGVLWLQGERKAGWWTMLAAAAWGAIAFFGIRAAFAPPEANLLHATTGSYLDHYFGQSNNLSETLTIRLLNAFVVVFPSLLITWRAPLWLLPGAILTLAVMVSSGPGPSYLYRYHHYALVVPFLIVALIYGLARLYHQQEKTPSPQPPRWQIAWRLQLMTVFIITLFFNAAFVNAPLNPFFHTTNQLEGRLPAEYGVTSRDAFLDDWMATHIPAEAPLLADFYLAPHLTNRAVLYLSDYDAAIRPFAEVLPDVDYVLFDLFTDPLWPEHFPWWQERINEVLADPGWQLAAAADGLLLFARQETGLSFAISREPVASQPNPTAIWQETIGLVRAEAQSLGNNRFLLSYTWMAYQPTSDLPPLLALTLIEGWDRGRIPHIPTLALAPPSTWSTGELITEQITIQLPEDWPPGSYPVMVNWYDYEQLEIFAAAGLTPDQPPLPALTLQIP